MSLQLVLAGLFPPQSTSMEWNSNLNWQPIPYSYESLNQDSLLLVRVKCPRYHEELQRVLDNEVSDAINENSQLLRNLSSITGLSIKTPDDVQSLFSTLQAEVSVCVLIFWFFTHETLLERVRRGAASMDQGILS
jgi:prostatic aicd phosphatase